MERPVSREQALAEIKRTARLFEVLLRSIPPSASELSLRERLTNCRAMKEMAARLVAAMDHWSGDGETENAVLQKQPKPPTALSEDDKANADWVGLALYEDLVDRAWMMVKLAKAVVEYQEEHGE